VLRARASPAHARASLTGLDGGSGHLLSARAVASHLGVSTATVYKLCGSGKLPHVRVGNAIRVEPGALVAFVAAGRVSPGT
jgi:excisionase family DNA binding protein